MVDLSTVSHRGNVVADFENTSLGRTDSVSQTLYVDAEAPKVKLLRMSDAADGKTSQIMWSATDDYKINESKLVMMGCLDYVQSLKPHSRMDLNALPANCSVIYQGAELAALGAQIAMTAKSLGTADVLPRDIIFGLYAEDMVGQSAFTWISKPDQEKGHLMLSVLPSAKVYTNNAAMPITIKLVHVVGGDVTQVDAAAQSKLWPDFEISSSAIPLAASLAAVTFVPSIPLSFTAEGLYTHVLTATEKSTGIVSNAQTVMYIYDKTPPVVDPLQITLDKTIPIPDTKVSVTWKATDGSGIGKQVLEIKTASQSAWTVVPGPIGSKDNTFSFAWGSRLSENFEARVTATDLAGNSDSNSGKWVEQIFNAAVITTSTECFFCHIKVIGDVGGINFPTNEQMCNDSGIRFEVVGTMYGTNAVPTKLSTNPGKASAIVSNYKNDDVKIFPKNEVFPTLDPRRSHHPVARVPKHPFKRWFHDTKRRFSLNCSRTCGAIRQRCIALQTERA
ncbi:MAG: hypothetical protein H7249_14190 [Chitinophagaceae bacterium]|nr:hypothetical protein [Oligoflexus sp.]